MITSAEDRRALLDGVAAAGGARAAIATLAALGGLEATPARAAAPALPRDGRSMLVVGGGIAGLVAALEMQRAGWSVRVLEAADRAGGRCMTLRGGDTVEEIGRAGAARRLGCRAASVFQPGPGAHPAPSPWHPRLLQGARRAAGSAGEREPRGAGGCAGRAGAAAAGAGGSARRRLGAGGEGAGRRRLGLPVTRPTWCGCGRRCGSGAGWMRNSVIAATRAQAGRKGRAPGWRRRSRMRRSTRAC